MGVTPERPVAGASRHPCNCDLRRCSIGVFLQVTEGNISASSTPPVVPLLFRACGAKARLTKKNKPPQLLPGSSTPDPDDFLHPKIQTTAPRNLLKMAHPESSNKIIGSSPHHHARMTSRLAVKSSREAGILELLRDRQRGNFTCCPIHGH